MRILIFGAGVIGSICAARLHEAGVDVTLLARGPRLADLQEHGVVLEDGKTGATTVTKVPLIGELEPGDRYDYILVVMRRNQVAGALPALAANSSPNVVFLGNRASGPDDLIASLGRERVLLGFAGSGGQRNGYVVRYLSTEGKPQSIYLGELSGEVTPRLHELGATLERAGFEPHYEARMDAWLRTHAAGGSTHALAGKPDLIRLGIDAAREILRAQIAAGIPVTPASISKSLRLPKPVMAGMVRRLARTDEAELGIAAHANAAKDGMGYLLGELRGLIARSGQPAPAFERLAELGFPC